MMRLNRTHNYTKSVIYGSVILAATVLLNSCSSGLRIKNLVNYPVILSSLEMLDDHAVAPDNVKYTGDEVSAYRAFTDNIRIQGRQDTRPVWTSDSLGCFQVTGGAKVHIQDFNIQGDNQDSILIQVDDGLLILENCDISTSKNWAIQIGPEGRLELRKVHFSNLSRGAIKLEGGQLKIYNSDFDFAGETAIYASSGKLLEVHNTALSNTMGNAIDLNAVEEVWLDSVKVLNSFQDGIHLNNCNFTLINNVESRGNGRNGLHLQNATISGLLDYSAIGNLVHGMLAKQVDTLRVVNSDYIGNGESGARIESVLTSKMAGIEVGHNGSDGFQFIGGTELSIHHSAFHANPAIALAIDSISAIQFMHNRVINNRNGIQVSHFDELDFRDNYVGSNTEEASRFSAGGNIHYTLNLIKENGHGLQIQDVEYVQFDSNRVNSNTMGGVFASIEQLTMEQNVWKANKSGSYFSDMGSISSSYDRWENSTEHAFEVLSAYDFILSNARFTGNTNAGLLNQVSVKMESCVFDSGTGTAVKLMNGSLSANESKFYNHTQGIELAEGSQAQIVQCDFKNTNLAVDAAASVSLALSFCNIEDVKNGLRIGNYGKSEILANTFQDIDGYSILATGPHLQSLYLRQNVMVATGGILNSKSSSGAIDIVNNSFVNNRKGLTMRAKTLNRLDHNIFYKTDISSFSMLKDQQAVLWNCFAPVKSESTSGINVDKNLFVDPLFAEKYYLTPESPCLSGGENSILIGALGTRMEERPSLKP